MLNETDIMRARFAPRDRVRFSFRTRTLEGIVVRANPKRAIVQAGGEEYHVPYVCLEALNEAGRHRLERLKRVHAAAVALLKKHGLSAWTFRFDHSTRRAGCCCFQERLISISLNMALHAADGDIQDTLLHEIAHALVGKRHHHDAVWRAKAREIGGSGRRCHRLQFVPPRYAVTCENHCWTQTAERRTPQLVCRSCGGKVLYTPYPAQGGAL
jgi:predicted SprT family Zn-dependent metalloprotease